jgi:hypothetical protein
VKGDMTMATLTTTKKTKTTTMHTLKRPKHPMPAAVRRALVERGLLEAYAARPAYQRNDWLGWISRAKRAETGQRRLESMLEELASGRGYMGMRWEPAVARPRLRRRSVEKG